MESYTDATFTSFCLFCKEIKIKLDPPIKQKIIKIT